MGAIEQLVSSYGIIVLALVLFLDGAGLPWPTAATLVLAGVAASAEHYSIFLAFGASLIGACGGAATSYQLGRRLGRVVLRRLARNLGLTEDKLDQVDRWSAENGDKAAFFGRFIPFVRSWIGYPAGITNLPFITYMLFSLAGYAIYIGVCLGAGYGGLELALWLGQLDILLWVFVPICLAFLWLSLARRVKVRQRGKG